MTSSMSDVHTGNKVRRIPYRLSLPPIPTSGDMASTKSCIEDPESISSSFTSEEPISIPEPAPRCESKTFQRSFRRARYCASPAETPMSVNTGGGAVEDVHDAVVKEVPNALVAHVYAGTIPSASNMIPIESSLDFGKAFKNASPSFILVDSCAQCANLTIAMLKDQAGHFDGEVIIVLVHQDVTKDFGPIVLRVPDFIDSGADDVLVVPDGATNINLLILASLSKARAGRDKRMMLEEQTRASTNQCDKLFWRIVHRILPDFPKIRPEFEDWMRCVAGMALVRKLGQGSFGSVYKWEGNMGNSTGAVKLFDKSKIYSFSDAMQLATEFALLARLKHDNVATFRKAVHGMQGVYLFMEFAGTRTLFNVIRAEGAPGLPWSRTGGLFSQITAGVAHCHKMLVAHCDLKPENIVISELGCAKIVDFGQAVDLAKAVAPLQGLKGTMPFIAPEIMCSCPNWIPPATDVWSLAVIVVEMILGNHAFVHLLGWHILGKELRNPSSSTQRAAELKVFFANDETNVLWNAILRISGLCWTSPPVIELLGTMFEFLPEDRILAESLAECIETISA